MDYKFTLQSSYDDLDLAALLMTPDEGKPHAILQLIHGMCDHKERYEPFMRYMTSKGYVCIIHDQRGHGESVKSQDDLGYMYDGGWQALIEDARLVNQWIHNKYPGLPLTLFGHSMGSLVARSFVKRYDDLVDRLIVCGCPSYNHGTPIALLLAHFIGALRGSHYRPQLLQRLSFGTFNRPFRHEGFAQAWVCSNPETLKAYHADPLCMFTFTVNGYENLFRLMLDCYSPKGWQMKNPSLPVSFISGACDPCRISDKAFHRAADLMRRVGYHHVTEKLYPGMLHEILNETDKIKVWEDITKNPRHPQRYMDTGVNPN